MNPPANVFLNYRLSNPDFVEETQIANIWKVQTSTGGRATLKIYHKPDMGAERRGFSLMSALYGMAAAKMHRHMPRVTVNLPSLHRWFNALDTLAFADDCPASAKRDLQAAQTLARHLLDTEQNITPLHGDLHHDNIRLGPRGYAAFDAKGLIGERAFELANAFRNPKGAGALHRSPARIRHLTNTWSQSYGVDAQRLLHWAAAKCALSIAWRSGGIVKHDPEFNLLAALLDSRP